MSKIAVQPRFCLGWRRVRVRLIACAYDLCSGQAPVDPVDPTLASEPDEARDGRRTCGDAVSLGIVFGELPLRGGMPWGRFPVSISGDVLWRCKDQVP